MRILLLENYLTFARAVVPFFLAGHRVEHVTPVAKAFAASRGSAYDAALVHYDLHHERGSDFVHDLRTSGVNLPIMAISARDEGDACLLAAGANASCSKLRFEKVAVVLKELFDSP